MFRCLLARYARQEKDMSPYRDIFRQDLITARVAQNAYVSICSNI
jgi:hypothetical protein